MLDMYDWFIGFQIFSMVVYGAMVGLLIWQCTIEGRRAYYLTQDYYTAGSLAVFVYAQINPLLIFLVAAGVLVVSTLAQVVRLFVHRSAQKEHEDTIAWCMNTRSRVNVLLQILVAWAISQVIVVSALSSSIPVWFLSGSSFALFAYVEHAHGGLTHQAREGFVRLSVWLYLGLFLTLLSSALYTSTGLSQASNLWARIGFGAFTMWGAVQGFMSFGYHTTASRQKTEKRQPKVWAMYAWEYAFKGIDMAVMILLSVCMCFSVIE